MSSDRERKSLNILKESAYDTCQVGHSVSAFSRLEDEGEGVWWAAVVKKKCTLDGIEGAFVVFAKETETRWVPREDIRHYGFNPTLFAAGDRLRRHNGSQGNTDGVAAAPGRIAATPMRTKTAPKTDNSSQPAPDHMDEDPTTPADRVQQSEKTRNVRVIKIIGDYVDDQDVRRFWTEFDVPPGEERWEWRTREHFVDDNGTVTLALLLYERVPLRIVLTKAHGADFLIEWADLPPTEWTWVHRADLPESLIYQLQKPLSISGHDLMRYIFILYDTVTRALLAPNHDRQATALFFPTFVFDALLGGIGTVVSSPTGCHGDRPFRYYTYDQLDPLMSRIRGDWDVGVSKDGGRLGAVDWGEDKGVLMRSFANQTANRKAHAPGNPPTPLPRAWVEKLKVVVYNKASSPAEDWRVANQMRAVNDIPEPNPGAMSDDDEDDRHLLAARRMAEILNRNESDDEDEYDY